MSRTRRHRPSDMGVWRWNESGTHARWAWRYDRADVRIVDRGVAPGRRGHDVREQSAFRLTLDDMRRHDADATGWLVTSCGRHRGGTRHRHVGDAVAAQAAALAWLDRRYRVEYPEQW